MLLNGTSHNRTDVGFPQGKMCVLLFPMKTPRIFTERAAPRVHPENKMPKTCQDMFKEESGGGLLCQLSKCSIELW